MISSIISDAIFLCRANFCAEFNIAGVCKSAWGKSPLRKVPITSECVGLWTPGRDSHNSLHVLRVNHKCYKSIDKVNKSRSVRDSSCYINPCHIISHHFTPPHPPRTEKVSSFVKSLKLGWNMEVQQHTQSQLMLHSYHYFLSCWIGINKKWKS